MFLKKYYIDIFSISFMDIDKKYHIIIDKTISYIKYNDSGILLVFLIAICFLAYFMPTVLFFSPSGTDVYSHAYNTQNMADASSLFGFYEESFKNEYQGYDYPFGMWYFGSILMKVTGMSSMELAIILPLAALFILLILYYIFALELLKISEGAILSTIFLISMPVLAIGMLNYSTSRYVVLFLIPILYIALQKPEIKTAIISLLLVFILGFSHTGTYMFLIFFSIMYFLIYAAVWKKLDRGFFILIVSLLFVYVQIAQYFPFVQPQYLDKGRFVITMADSLASISGLGFISEMGTLFYENIFVSSNIVYVLFWSSLLYVVSKLIIITRVRTENLFAPQNKFAALPILDNVSQISHDIISAPFWIGPVHSVLAMIGFFKLDARGKCIFLALIGTSFVPGAMKFAGTAGGTTTREIFYLFLIIPVAAAAGFYVLLALVKRYSVKKHYSIPTLAIYVLILIPLIVAPIIGSIYYAPSISGTEQEKTNLQWLNTTGNSFEGAEGPGYRERIDIYAQKLTPSIEAGSETNRYMDDLYKTYFYEGAEEYTRDLNSFNIKYILQSERTQKGFVEGVESLKISTNLMLDRIFASDNNFAIYRYISPPENNQKISIEEFPLVFTNSNTSLQKSGSLYLFENDYYKVKLGETTPGIQYIGTNTENLLGGGSLGEFLTITWSGKYHENIVGYILEDLDCDVTHEGNRIVYRTTIYDDKNTEKWATLIIKYIFYEKAFKREIVVANDWQNYESSVKMNCGITQMVYAPFNCFEIMQLTNGLEKPIRKHIYPSEDNVVLKDTIFSEIFINETEKGFLIRYGNTMPYPQQLVYRGSPYYEGVGNIMIDSKRDLNPSEPFILEQYYAVGTAQDSKDFIDEYTSVSRWDFAGGITPVVITGSARNSNEIEPVREMFERLDIPYNQIMSQKENEYLTNSNPIGQVNVYSDDTFLTQPEQKFVITNALKTTGATGSLFANFRYNLDSLRALSEVGGAYTEAYTVFPPYEKIDQSGSRELKRAYIEGNRTDIVLFPVSMPFSYLLRPEYESDEALQQWSDIITGVLTNGGIAIFQWDIQDLADTSYRNDIGEMLYSAAQNGISYTTLDDVTSHYLMMENVYANVTKDIDEVHLTLTNTNPYQVKQATYRVVLPTIDGDAPYFVENGSMSRHYITGDTVVLYVSCDLKPGETKEVVVHPSIERKQFLIDANELFEGLSTIVIMDDDNNPVKNAHITVQGKTYESDEEGKVSLNIRRGEYAVVIEKPGYTSVRFVIEVKGRIYQYLMF